MTTEKLDKQENKSPKPKKNKPKSIQFLSQLIIAFFTSSSIGLVLAAIINKLPQTEDKIVQDLIDSAYCQFVEISNYKDGSQITLDVNSPTNQVTLKGKLSGNNNVLPEGYTLWIFAQPNGSKNYFPFSDPAIINDGQWQSVGYTKVYKEEKSYKFIPIILPQDEKEKLEKQIRQLEAQEKTRKISQLPYSRQCSPITVTFSPKSLSEK